MDALALCFDDDDEFLSLFSAEREGDEREKETTVNVIVGRRLPGTSGRLCTPVMCRKRIVPVAKEKLCCMGLDYDTTLTSNADISKEETYDLPDGNIVIVGAERFQCVKVFLPSFTGKEAGGCHDTSFRNIVKCDVDIHKELYADVVLSGGTAIFHGMLSVSAPSTMKIDVIAPTRHGLEVLSCLPPDSLRTAACFSFH